jgi:fatty acid desaturase
MSLGQYPIPVRWNLIVIAVQIVAFIVILSGAALATSWWQLFALSIAFAIVGNSIYAIVHEAEHGLLHPSHRVNELLGICMALLFPAPYHLLRQGHLGHHCRNRSDDEAFDLYFDGDRPFLKWLQLYGILTGMYWGLIVLSNFVVVLMPFMLDRRYFAFDRPSVAFMDSLNPSYMRRIRIEGVAATMLHAALIWWFRIPLLNYVVVYFGFGFSWSAMQYVHHFGTERHVLLGARNLRLFRWLDWLWLNHNWHQIHHEHPTIPWIFLPQLARPNEKRPDFLLWHYLRMWRGPRYTTQRVENRFAGQVIRLEKKP